MGKLSPKLRDALLKSVLEQAVREADCNVSYYLEYKFHLERRWRFDAALWVETTRVEKWALEVEGLGGSKGSEGRHRSIGGFLKDMEKYNEAALAGFRILRVTWKQVEDGTCLSLLRRACGGEG